MTFRPNCIVLVFSSGSGLLLCHLYTLSHVFQQGRALPLVTKTAWNDGPNAEDVQLGPPIRIPDVVIFHRCP